MNSLFIFFRIKNHFLFREDSHVYGQLYQKNTDAAYVITKSKYQWICAITDLRRNDFPIYHSIDIGLIFAL